MYYIISASVRYNLYLRFFTRILNKKYVGKLLKAATQGWLYNKNIGILSFYISVSIEARRWTSKDTNSLSSRRRYLSDKNYLYLYQRVRFWQLQAWNKNLFDSRLQSESNKCGDSIMSSGNASTIKHLNIFASAKRKYKSH